MYYVKINLNFLWENKVLKVSMNEIRVKVLLGF